MQVAAALLASAAADRRRQGVPQANAFQRSLIELVLDAMGRLELRHSAQLCHDIVQLGVGLDVPRSSRGIFRIGRMDRRSMPGGLARAMSSLPARARASMDAAVARDMLPAIRLIVQQPGAGLARRVPQALAISALARGGLPFRLDAATRHQYLEYGLGQQPQHRAQAIRSLSAICRGTVEAGRDAATRQSAGRVLHHLLAAGGHGLSNAQVASAREAVMAAFRDSGWRNADRHLPLAAELLNEAKRDGAPLPPALAATLLTRLLRGWDLVCILEHVPLLATVYDQLPKADRDTLREGLLAHLPKDGSQPQEQQIGLQLLRQIAKTDAADPKELLKLAHEVLPRLKKPDEEEDAARDIQQAAMEQLFDEFHGASENGQLAVLGFVEGLKDDRLASAAAGILNRVLLVELKVQLSDQNDKAMAEVHDGLPGLEEEKERLPLPAAVKAKAAAVVSDAFNRLSNAQLSDLNRTVIKGGTPLSEPLWQTFLDHAHKLHGAELSGLLTAWCNSQPILDERQFHALQPKWAKARDHLGESECEMLDAFLHLAERVRTPADARKDTPSSALTSHAAEELAVALTQMNSACLDAALPLFDWASLSGAQRDGVSDSILKRLSALSLVSEHSEKQALALSFELSSRRGLHALAQRVGMPQMRSGKIVIEEGKVVRHDWSQSIPLQGDGSLGLKAELELRPAKDVAPALEAIAERYRSLPEALQLETAALFKHRLKDLSPLQQQRLQDTLALHNPDLLDRQDHLRSLGFVLDDTIWDRARRLHGGVGNKKIDRELAEERDKLRESRFSAH